MIDDLFNLIINKSNTISNEFYTLLDKLELNYTTDIIKKHQIENLQIIKEIIYTLYELFKDNLQSILAKAKRNELIALYNVCKTFETDSFISYYKKSIVNKYMN